MEKEEYVLGSPFECESGEVIENLKITYHISRHESSRVIWICHALTANSDPSEWWPELVGNGKPIDTGKYTVVCANMLCSPYGSSGPLTGPSYLGFPKITIRDMVKAEILLKRHLGIKSIDILIGGSIGGFQVLEWAIMDPGSIRHAVLIACGARVTPWATAYNEAQRMAIEADPTFFKQKDAGSGKEGLKAARAIALISYRSYKGYNSTQHEDDENALFARKACSYERHQGKKLSDRFDAYSYWYLTHAVDSHNAGRDRGGIQKALNGIRAECTVIGIDTDNLFPTEEQKAMARHIPNAGYRELHSDFGHDGFLLEYEQLIRILEERTFLRQAAHKHAAQNGIQITNH